MRYLGVVGFSVWLVCSITAISMTSYVVWKHSQSRAVERNAPTSSVDQSERVATIQTTGPVTAPITQITGDQTINNYYSEFPSDPQFDALATEERLTLKAPDGRDANVTVYVLWREASWKEGRAVWNKQAKLAEFLKSSLLTKALATEDVIACVGLVSNEMRRELQNATADEKEKELGALSDKRAWKLCELIADETQSISTTPRFVGLGLGYNVVGNNSQDDKQRALVFLGITAPSGKPFEKADVDAIIRDVLDEDTLHDFEPVRYSRVVENRPICWVSIQRGVYTPSPPDCD